MNTRCEVAIVADDLTGALDAAAPFAERGMATRVAVSLEGLEAALADGGSAPRVVAVNTGSRHLDADTAARRTREAAERLHACQPRLLLKKVDSTLRGQVVAEAVALRRSGGRRLLVCPAVPSQGRSVVGGEVWVDGEPLAATAFSRDALSPPLAGPLDRAFAAGGVPLLRYVAEAGLPLPAGDCVADAADDATLARLATRLLDAPGEWLPVCAAGLAHALAQCLAPAQCRAWPPWASWPPSLPEPARALLAVGSRSPRARRQLDLLREAFPEVPCQPAFGPGGADGERGVRVIVPGVPAGLAPSAEAVATAMAEAVVAAGGDERGVLLFLSGGDVALAVLARLRGEYVELFGEWCPGVPLGLVNGDAGRPVMTKAGGFGAEALLVRLVEQVRHSSRVE
ncbi:MULTISPECIES: four-carbon acid sugar kinase family protein [unclassified Halomonas]|uniref:four-carbon acid sugar kinase family protein n=1 Tax=unclassified Halomonas TaxID=2609666 RepID=UPI001F39699B|nr:four-carbon acid sugar kinase family protein [Halomonas sp. SS10-MC5]